VPTNELLYSLKRTYTDANIMTYQTLLTYNELYKKSIYNIILDESTMIGLKDFNKLLEIIYSNNMRLFVIGDFNIDTGVSYQLEPVNDVSIFGKIKNILYDEEQDDIKYITKEDIYHLNLKTNYRQGGDQELKTFLNKMRGKHNNYIKKCVSDSDLFKKIKSEDISNYYALGDKVLGSRNTFIDKINDTLINNNNEMIQIMHLKTTTTHAKNETEIIKRTEYNNKIHRLGFAQTAHSCQGCTFNNNVFINIDNLFTNNILYVMLSRAQNKDQIYIIE
jgi:hypothetical protein